MAQCVVIADDLTGANATGVLLQKSGYESYTVMNIEKTAFLKSAGCDCLLYTTDSRAVKPEIAYDRVYNACRSLMNDDIKVYGKRIDSTLRGNLGSETDAMLNCLGKDYIAIVAPCFPASGRIVIGGYMLVNGVLLHKTDIADDPKTPVRISEAAPLFSAQSKYRVASIYMKDLMYDRDYLADLMRKKISEGNRILIFDCVTQDDLDLIADAVIAGKFKAVAVDPGVFTATLTRKLVMPSEKKSKNKILAVVGSVNPNTCAQMEELWQSQKIFNEFVDAKEFLEGEERREKEIGRVVGRVLDACDKNTVFSVTGNGIYPENLIDFSLYTSRYNCSPDDVTGLINTAFAEITCRIMKAVPDFKGLYTSGGDITSAVCRRADAAGLALIDEVLPLAAYCAFLDGDLKGTHIITKGGSQGGRDAISRCITYLKEKLNIKI